MAETNAPPTGNARAEQRAPDDPDPRLLRALADLDNVRKRYERRLADAAFDEQSRVLSLWLPVVDDLERALEHGGDESQIVAGVRSVYEHALAVLARMGVTRFDDIGAQFDPGRHEAVGTVETTTAPGEIVAAVQPGYIRDGVTLRPARVVVSRPPDRGPPDPRSHEEKSPLAEPSYEEKPG